MSIISVDKLGKIYNEGSEKISALSDISFTVEKGEFVAIMGTSGSGKSTLLHILGGVDTPTFGKVTIEGKNIFTQSKDQLSIFRRRKVGIIYQFFNLIPNLTVKENIQLPILLDGRKVNKERFNQLVEFLQLENRLNHHPEHLSGGQQQKVAIGRALINAPAILLADEPTGNLDNYNGQRVIELLKEANKQFEQTILMVTHDENIGLQSHRIMRIEDGKLTNDERILR